MKVSLVLLSLTLECSLFVLFMLFLETGNGRLYRIVGHFFQDEFLAGEIEIRLDLFLTSRTRTWTVDAKEMVITPQEPIAVSEEDSGDDGRPVQKTRRIPQRFHKQLSVFDEQLTVFSLDAQSRQLDVRLRISVVTSDQSPILLHVKKHARVPS